MYFLAKILNISVSLSIHLKAYFLISNYYPNIVFFTLTFPF
jgi:hypothetical protein